MPHIEADDGIREDIVDRIRNMATTIADDHLRLRDSK